MASEHIVKSFDEQLQQLDSLISRMGGMTETQIESAIQAVDRRDAELAVKVREKDAEIDALEHEVDALAVRLLALRQPVGIDLPHIVAALQTSSDLQRTAHLAKNIPKRAVALTQVPQLPTPGLSRLASLLKTITQTTGRDPSGEGGRQD